MNKKTPALAFAFYTPDAMLRWEDERQHKDIPDSDYDSFVASFHWVPDMRPIIGGSLAEEAEPQPGFVRLNDYFHIHAETEDGPYRVTLWEMWEDPTPVEFETLTDAINSAYVWGIHEGFL